MAEEPSPPPPPIRLMNFVSEEQLDEVKRTRGERVEDGTAQRDRPLFEVWLECMGSFCFISSFELFKCEGKLLSTTKKCEGKSSTKFCWCCDIGLCGFYSKHGCGEHGAMAYCGNGDLFNFL
ncbi:hypothetical protein QQ045_003970 [Rhodiola kirilowii]